MEEELRFIGRRWNDILREMKLCLLCNKNENVCSALNSPRLYLNPSKMNRCRINWTGDAGSIGRNPSLFLSSITPYQATRPSLPDHPSFRNLQTRQSFSDHGIVWIYCLHRETPTFTTQVKACRNARHPSTSSRALFSIFLHFLYTS